MELDGTERMLDKERATECLVPPFPPVSSVVLKPGEIDTFGNDQTNHQATFASIKVTQSSSQKNDTSSDITVTLENESAWNRFHSLGTEMILTKQGRRMFPCCRFRLSGLDQQKKYFLVMDIIPLDDFTYMWDGKSWEPVTVDDSHLLGQICVHPESPAVGQQWMNSPVSFYKVKLTSETTDEEGCVILRPMRRYLPRLHIVPFDPGSERTIALDSPNVKIFSFAQTEFYAVISYQNPRITQLKIDCNPFAMAFKEDNQSIRIQDKLQSLSSFSALFQSPLLNLAQKISERQKEGAVKNKGLTCIQDNRTNVIYPVADSPEEGEGIFTKIRNDVIRNLNMGDIKNGGGSKATVNKCPAEPVLGEHMAPLQFDPNESVSSEESMPDTVEPVSPINSNKNSESSESFVDVISSEKAFTDSTLPTESSMSAQSSQNQSATVSPSRTHCVKVNQVQARKPGHLIERKQYRRGRKAKAKLWSNVKCRKPAPAAVSQKVPLQPDLEDVEGMLFVSFVAKEALNINAKKESKISLSPPSSTHEQSDTPELKDVNFSVAEQIAELEKTLLLNLKQQKYRQVIHPCLQDVGIKLSLLDLHSPIDLQYLGVHLPLPSPILEGLDKINLTSLSSSPEAAGIFVSRTGKTNDLTKIKGWREKFKTSAVQSASEGLKNSSAFCSDMLDAYLENEAQQISDRVAVFSTCSSSPVSYQLPSKSSSYVVTLDSRLKTRSGSSNKANSKPIEEMPRFSAQRHTRSSFQAERSIRFVSKPERKKQLDKSLLGLNSIVETTSHIKRVPANSRKKKLLHQMEKEVIIHGYNRTHITAARAKLALTALINFMKKNKRPKFHMQPHNKNDCSEAFCHLGCVCESLDREIRGPTHCRRVECMFECNCFKHKVLLLHPEEKTPAVQQGRKRSVLAFPIADPEREPRPSPALTINSLWKRKSGEHDPEPIFVPVPSVDSKYMPKKVPDEDKDPVYLYFESMMTCARVREFNSNPPPQIHMFPTKKDKKEPEHIDQTGEVKLPLSKKITETSPTEMALKPSKCLPTKLLEILSECNWEPHRNLVLNTLFRRMECNLLYQPFCLAMYKIQLISLTVKGVGKSSTATYKVCISRAEDKAMIDDLQAPVKKTEKKQCLKGVGRKISKICETQAQGKADVYSGSKSNVMMKNQPKKPRPKKVLIPMSFVFGYLKANIRKLGTPSRGLIEVNGKSYSKAKLQLGTLGALHPVNRFAAFITGRLLHGQTKIVGSISKKPFKLGPKPESITGNVANLPNLNLPLARPHSAGMLEPNTTSSNTPSKSVGPPTGKIGVVPDGTQFVIVPVTPSNSAAAPSDESVTGSTLPPGQQVVLQPVTGMPGSTFVCQFNGQMIQLKPISAGPLQQPPSSVNEGSTTQCTTVYNTGLPNQTRSLQMPLTSIPFPKMLPKPFADIAPKRHSLSGTSSINISSGTPAIKCLQSDFPGKMGTFSFRICPPTAEKTLVGSEHGVKNTELAKSSFVALPGGFTLLKLNTNTNDISASPTEILRDHETAVKPVLQSCLFKQEPNCQDSEISNPVETSNCNSSQESIDSLNHSRNGAFFKVVIEDESVEHSVSENTVTPNGNGWIPEGAVMVHKSHVSEPESKDMDDWPPKGAEQILWRDTADEEENLKEASKEAPNIQNSGLQSDEGMRTKSFSMLNINIKDEVSEPIINTYNINAENICKEEPAFVDKPEQISFSSSVFNEQVMIQEENLSIFGQTERYDKLIETDVAGNEPSIKDQGGNSTSDNCKKENYSNQTWQNTSLNHIPISKNLDSVNNDNSAPRSLLGGQKFVNSTPTVCLRNTSSLAQKTGLNNILLLPDMMKSSPELPDRLGNLSNKYIDSSQNCGADEIVINLSEDENPCIKFARAEDNSGDDDGDLNSSDEEISSNDYTSDSEPTDNSANTTNEDIDVESFKNDGEILLNMLKKQHRQQHKTNGAALIKQKDLKSLSKSVYPATDDLERRLRHTKKERARRFEMRHSFAALKKALNVEEHVKLSSYDILNQARLMICALKDRSQDLEKRKKALQQTQLVYISKLVELAKVPEVKIKAGLEEQCDQQKLVGSQNTLQTSLTSPPVNTRLLDGEDNQLPPCLGHWKAPNYIHRRSDNPLQQPFITDTGSHLAPDLPSGHSVKSVKCSLPKMGAVKLDTEIKTADSNSTQVGPVNG